MKKCLLFILLVAFGFTPCFSQSLKLFDQFGLDVKQVCKLSEIEKINYYQFNTTDCSVELVVFDNTNKIILKRTIKPFSYKGIKLPINNFYWFECNYYGRKHLESKGVKGVVKGKLIYFKKEEVHFLENVFSKPLNKNVV